MAFSLPDDGEGLSGLQSILFQEYLEALVAGATGQDCVLSGGAVSTSSGLTVSIAKAAVLSNGVLLAVAASTKTHAAADATNPRLDLVVVDSAGALQIRQGTAAAAPTPAVRTANDVLLAVVYISAGLATVASGNIVDLRVVVSGPVVLKKSTAGVTFNTTGAAETYFSVTLPSGLLLAGRAVRVRMGGNWLANDGSVRAWTLTITYGGTTIYQGATAGASKVTTRGAWWMDFILKASADAAQELLGIIFCPGVGPRTAPTTGTAGDLAATTARAVPIRGATAVDSGAADRALVVKFTMESGALNETVMDYAHAELL